MFHKLFESDYFQVFCAHFTAIVQVVIVHVFAVALTFTNLDSWLKTGGLAVALGFGIWKWRVEYKREQRLRKMEEENEGF
jgi:type IV secretory pathway TrbL component